MMDISGRLSPRRPSRGEAWVPDPTGALKPLECRCAYCEFVVSAPLAEAHRKFERHKCGRPKPTTTVRRKRGFALRSRPVAGTLPVR
jgi:hypothetical protein